MSNESHFLLRTLAFVLFVFFGTSWTLHYNHSSSLGSNKRSTQSKLDIIAQQIEFELFAKLPSLVNELSYESSAKKLLTSTSSNSLQLDSVLYSIRKYFKTESCYILNAQGIVVASNTNDGVSIKGKNYSFRKYFSRAFKGESSSWAAVGLRSKLRGIYFSSPIKDRQEIIGVAVIKVGLLELDHILNSSKQPLALISNDGIVFASNQGKWLMKSLESKTDLDRLGLIDSQKYGHYQMESLDFIFDHDMAKRNGDFFQTYQTPMSLAGWKLVQFHLISKIS
ncbi:hypothetical protein MJH12_02415 [bacterium]|nr:hypothetical protein [bacterium]